MPFSGSLAKCQRLAKSMHLENHVKAANSILAISQQKKKQPKRFRPTARAIIPAGKWLGQPIYEG